jgi:hypothetical protein
MAARIHELRAAREKLATEANAALVVARDKAKAEGRSLTAEELKAQDDFDAKIKAHDGDIKIEERLLDRERHMGSRAPARDPQAVAVPGSGPQASVTVGAPNFEKDPAKGFASHREFLLAAMDGASARSKDDVSDERLRMLAVADDSKGNRGELAYLLPIAFTPRSVIRATVGSDEQAEYSDVYGGFSVVKQRLAPLPLVGFEGDPTAGRTLALPMGAPAVEIEAATDKDHTTSVSAGLTFTRRPETTTVTATRQAREMLNFKASSLMAISYVTEELLDDSPGTWIARLDQGYRMQRDAHMFNEKLRGLGGNQYLGILTALASATLGPTITVAKVGAQVADTIVADNALSMRSRCWGYGQAIWVTNHDCYPQLAKMAIPVGVGGSTLIYQQSMVEDRPDMLLGRPIFYSEYASKLGDFGDLMLLNCSQFAEGIYQPLKSAESIHVRFIYNERTFLFTERNCGQPLWRVPLTPNKSPATISPFVVLAERA